MLVSGPAAPLLLLLVASGAAGHTSRYQPPAQTEWQKRLFQNVSQSAARLSAAAVPALLKTLDEPSFREQLAQCCPSVSQLSAEQLLSRLQQETAVAEVASGFPASQGADDVLGMLTGMTIADGLEGSWFQNQWQWQLLHNASFRRDVYEHVRATVNKSTNMASLEIWSQSTDDCSAAAAWTVSAPLDVCTLSSGMLTQFTFNGTALTQRGWKNQQLGPFSPSSHRPHRWQHHGAWTPMHWAQPCPSTEPLFEKSYVADGSCTKQAAEWENNTIYMWQFFDTAEMRLYGLKPFSKFGEPETLDESVERGVYTMVNLFLIDQGSPLFGDVSAVFSMAAVKSRALISAIDTGYFEGQCNSSRPFGFFNVSSNCSAYKPFEMLGTMDHFNHLLLTNAEFWASSQALARRFARLEGSWGTHPVTGADAITYFEAVPAGTFLYPTDIRFLIGNFGSLFGSTLGEKLQEWAMKRGWILVWTLGFNLGDDKLSWMNFNDVDTVRASANSRLVDPVVAAKSTAAASLPLRSTNTSHFRQLWAKMASKRHIGNISNATAFQFWRQLVAGMPAGLRVSPLRASTCTEPLAAGRECVGVSGEGRCVCYAAVGPSIAMPSPGSANSSRDEAWSSAATSGAVSSTRLAERAASFVV